MTIYLRVIICDGLLGLAILAMFVALSVLEQRAAEKDRIMSDFEYEGLFDRANKSSAQWQAQQRRKEQQRVRDLSGPADRLILNMIDELLEGLGAVRVPGETTFDTLSNFLSSRRNTSPDSVTVAHAWKLLSMNDVAMPDDATLVEGIKTLIAQRDTERAVAEEKQRQLDAIRSVVILDAGIVVLPQESTEEGVRKLALRDRLSTQLLADQEANDAL